MKRIWNNLKWLFNHPPTGLTNSTTIVQCDYCGKKSDEIGVWTVIGAYSICGLCQKKVYDKVLKGE